MRRALHLVFVTLGVLLSGATLGIVALSAWLVSTPDGLRWLADFARRAQLAQIEMDAVEGRLLGPLDIRGFRLALPGVEIRARRLRLEWSPLPLLDNRLNLDLLAAEQLRVTVLGTAGGDAAPATPMTTFPQLPLALRLDRLRVDRLDLSLPGNEPQRIDRIALDGFAWQGEALRVDRLAAEHASSGALELALTARLSGAQAQIERLDLRSRGPGPEARISATGTVQLDQAPSNLDLSWSGLRWPLDVAQTAVLTSAEGRLRLEGRAQAFSARGGLALGDTAQIQVQARYSREQVDARLSWKRLGWPLLGPPRLYSAEGRAEVGGTPSAYRYTLQAELAAEGKAGVAQAQGSGGLDHVRLDRLHLDVARSEISGQAQVFWQPALDINADLRLSKVNPGLIDPAWPGILNGTLRARTLFIGELPQVDFELALDRSELRGYPLTVTTQGRALGPAVDLERLQLVSGPSRIEGRGRVTPPLDLQARLQSTDLASLWPGLAGRVELDARVQGALETPRVVAKGSASDFGFESLRIATLSLDGDVDLPGAWTLDADARGLTGPFEAERLRVRVDGSAAAHRLGLELQTEAATAELEARGAFDRGARAWSGELGAGRLAPAGLPAWTLEAPAALHLDPQRIQLDPACWAAGVSRVCAQGTRDAEHLRTAFRLEQLDFAYFASLLPEGWAASGGIDGSGVVELRGGAPSEIRADLRTRPIRVARDGQLLFQAEAGSASVEETEGRALAQLQLPLHQGHLSFRGELGPADEPSQRPLRAELDVELSDLGFLRMASEDVEDLSGRIEGRMQWTGTVAAPQPSGELRLVGGRMRLSTPGIELEDLSARVGSRDGTASALDVTASARSDGGLLSIDGQAQFAGGMPRADLRIRGERFRAANMPDVRAWISPDLQLQLAEGRIDLRGEVQVPRADITPVSFDSGVAASRDQVIVDGAQDPGAANALKFGADVRVVLGEQVTVDGFGLKTRLSGSVRAIEESGRPGSGRGEVRLEGGRYQAYGQDLEIEYGRLLFNGGPLSEPAIEIRARRKPREDIEVGVMVRGTLDRPEFQLYSTPSMPRERQLSWLVLGRSLEETGSGDEKALLANAALSLGLSGTDFLAQSLRGGLRLDEISIGSEPGEDAQLAKFTVGKYLSPKLYVSYGVGLFQPGHVFKLLYDLGHGFKVSTESGVQTGGDLLYSVERR